MANLWELRHTFCYEFLMEFIADILESYSLAFIFCSAIVLICAIYYLIGPYNFSSFALYIAYSSVVVGVGMALGRFGQSAIILKKESNKGGISVHAYGTQITSNAALFLVATMTPGEVDAIQAISRVAIICGTLFGLIIIYQYESKLHKKWIQIYISIFVAAVALTAISGEFIRVKLIWLLIILLTVYVFIGLILQTKKNITEGVGTLSIAEPLSGLILGIATCFHCLVLYESGDKEKAKLTAIFVINVLPATAWTITYFLSYYGGNKKQKKVSNSN